MSRITVPEADEVLHREFPVRDHGFVRLIDYLGGDSRITAAARVSYGPGTNSAKDDRAYWQIDLHNLFRFLWLRLDHDAQYEIRKYAELIASIAKLVTPVAFEAFEEHDLCAKSVSKPLVSRLHELLGPLASSSSEAAEIAKELERQ